MWIRPARISDVDALFETIQTYVSNSDYIPKNSDEIINNKEEKIKWINSLINQPNSILLVAEYKNKIIGNIDVTGGQRTAMRHLGYIGLGMLREWQNVGLGTLFFRAVIDWAITHHQLEILWLQTYAQNIGGVQLYQKVGFVQKGKIEHFFKQRGQYYDNLIMTLDLPSSIKT